jgi:uncharacterized protein YndB with AHSA1/START domain
MISISVTIKTSIENAWNCFTNPKHITNWNFASNDWHCPKVTNDVVIGGLLCFTMAAKDGSESFDLKAKYTEVDLYKKLEYTLTDSRKVTVLFSSDKDNIIINQSFDPENENSLELQQAGWQAILNNFKNYTESTQ